MTNALSFFLSAGSEAAPLAGEASAELLVLACVLMLLAGITIWLEIWLPSFGILTFFTLTGIIAGLVLAWKSGVPNGVFIAGAFGVFVQILCITLAFKLLKFSPFVHHGAITATAGDKPEIKDYSKLTGRVGEVMSDLRPSGMAMFGDLKIDVVAVDGYIEKGNKVEVVNVSGNVVTVKGVDA